MTCPSYHSPFHLLFPPYAYPSIPVGETVPHLVSSNTKSLLYLLKSLPTNLAPLVVSSLLYAATGTALFLLDTSARLVESRLLRAAAVVPNHRIFHFLLEGSTSLDRQNSRNFLKPAVDRQQRKFSKTVSCPTTTVCFPPTNPNPNP